jgi:predicted nucleic acid-binding protein
LIVIVDTCAVIAIFDRRHPSNMQLKKLLLTEDNLYIIPSTVVTEACYILNTRFGVKFEISFIFEPVQFEDLERIIELLEKYKDLNLGYCDSAIIAISERFGTNKILTLDRKHFNVVIPKGFDYFDILFIQL